MNESLTSLCLIGEVVVDVGLDHGRSVRNMRLGGVVHAARALWAMGIDYDLRFVAPDYLVDKTTHYAMHHGAASCIQIGVVNNSPNVMLVSDSTESGNQGYELILRDEYECRFLQDAAKHLNKNPRWEDIVVFPGNYELGSVVEFIEKGGGQIHIDIANGVSKLESFLQFGDVFETILLSTSSPLFLNFTDRNVDELAQIILDTNCKTFIFKENRGGSRAFARGNPEPISVGSQTQPIVHSVGIGDCFDVAYVGLRRKHDTKQALLYSSWIAAEYARTTFVDDFKKGVERVLKIPAEGIVGFQGTSLPWETRSEIDIYIAGPDFDYIDTRPIDRVVEALKYHNFSPRLPVRENGQVSPNDTSDSERRAIFFRDLRLLHECEMMVAVLLSHDPGTLVEIGYAAALKMPVFVFDPYRIADNLMLVELPRLVTDNLDEVVSAVFTSAATLGGA